MTRTTTTSSSTPPSPPPPPPPPATRPRPHPPAPTATTSSSSAAIVIKCMSKDRPSLLQVYVSFYTIIESMWEHLKIGHFPFYDSLFVPNLKVSIVRNRFMA
ncbi:uncharacterized protein LOC133885833 isoform X2 [Phragmites australis]|uniref:uncharacterized protein LOC133885833 isoform X2 n=1 Tax=Phragmites australis TaxID=29695 RepID=UPI002D790B05|nr:uncharacterized protein LOC133885833 isoform X2 [Phragmites australis]